MKLDQKYLIVVAGPTAVGKTALAIQLAQNYQTVILSADSRQFYRQISIGTAKPKKEELEAVQHYFINTKNIDELYGAGHFEKDALLLLEELFKKHQVVIVVGGSGLYIDALLNGVDEFEEVPSKIREKLNEEFLAKGLLWLQSELLAVDPIYYEKVDKMNSQRIIRALEVYRHSAKPYSDFLKSKEKQRHFTPIKLLISIERAELYQKINHRVDQMMREGLLDEVKSLQAYEHLNALKTIGYKELFDYMNGKYSLEQAIEKIKQHTRNYAKRQITWFKNRNNYETFQPDETDKIMAYIDIILSNG